MQDAGYKMPERRTPRGPRRVCSCGAVMRGEDGGKRWYCDACGAVATRWAMMPEAERQAYRAATCRRRKAKTAVFHHWIDEIKRNVGCENPECRWHGPLPPYALDFDHVDIAHKSFGIARAGNGTGEISIAAFVRELEKCILLCAICHRARHWQGRERFARV